ncbi:SMI1/KNR4 family protein [Rubinisphaera sp. JC750]|uniref:SMI1/KNR4 family protein n=1 Tax=Rubinisphaera sp. JC750 TaxID=2898658 RepID=UPI001F47C1E3|nr:SMI1/KNR4 family protein [Rubinisphaera sp. JC750]
MTWRELIESWTSVCHFASPATEQELATAEQQLRLELPVQLRRLLKETNGLQGEYGISLVWPVDRIVADNLLFRSTADFQQLYMPFDSLLFFADAGNGDQFAFPIQSSSIRRDDVFVWNHEDDSRTWVAPSLEKYLEWWLDGTIQV